MLRRRVLNGRCDELSVDPKSSKNLGKDVEVLDEEEADEEVELNGLKKDMQLMLGARRGGRSPPQGPRRAVTRPAPAWLRRRRHAAGARA